MYTSELQDSNEQELVRVLSQFEFGLTSADLEIEMRDFLRLSKVSLDTIVRVAISKSVVHMNDGRLVGTDILPSASSLVKSPLDRYRSRYGNTSMGITTPTPAVSDPVTTSISSLIGDLDRASVKGAIAQALYEDDDVLFSIGQLSTKCNIEYSAVQRALISLVRPSIATGRTHGLSYATKSGGGRASRYAWSKDYRVPYSQNGATESLPRVKSKESINDMVRTVRLQSLGKLRKMCEENLLLSRSRVRIAQLEIDETHAMLIKISEAEKVLEGTTA